MQANSDFKDLLRIFNEEDVEFLVVGAHAVIHFAEPRYTKDVNIWVGTSPENARRVFRALGRFGAPLAGVRESDFTQEDLVYQMGVVPNRIDIMMGVDGLHFPDAWRNRIKATYDGVPMNLLSREDLIRNKRASGRPQDLLDLERLLDGDRTDN